MIRITICDDLISDIEQVKKRRGKIISIILVCVLVVAIAAGFTVWFLNADPVDKNVLAEAIREEYTVLIGYNTENANSLITTLYNGFEIEVLSASAKGGEITAQCSFSNYDITAALNSLSVIDTEMTYASYMEKLTKAVESQGKLRHEVTVSVIAEADGGYKVSFTEAQLDMAMGGFLSYYQAQYETEVEG